MKWGKGWHRRVLAMGLASEAGQKLRKISKEERIPFPGEG